MTELSANLALPLLQPSQAQKHVTHNEALQLLDILAQLTVAGFGATTPPALPETGQVYALGAGTTGDWAGHDGALAAWDGTAWLFLSPREGWRASARDNGEQRVYSQGAWRQPPLDGLAHLGVNTSADASNRLAVSAAATLLSHDGAGHRVKVNKAGTADTASLLFQSGWSGRAEMGLAGDEDFSIKVSTDGSAWTTALRIDRASGTLQAGSYGGAGVQAAPTDTTAGRLMRADYGYGPGNLLGPVTQSGGTPTGAVIERGADATGDYVRFADGTQICTVNGLSVGYVNASRCTVNWTMPAAFASGTAYAVTTSLDTGASTLTPSANELTGPTVDPIDADTVSISVRSITGLTGFAAGDAAAVAAIAIGRWF